MSMLIGPYRFALWWISSSRLYGNAVYSLTALGRADEAIQLADKALRGLDHSYVRRRAEVMLDRTEALIVKREIAESADQLSRVADIAARHSNAGLVDNLHRKRQQLSPWATNSSVRQLDEHMRQLGLAGQT